MSWVLIYWFGTVAAWFINFITVLYFSPPATSRAFAIFAMCALLFPVGVPYWIAYCVRNQRKPTP